MKLMTTLAALSLFLMAGVAQAACPTNATVTVPYPTGAADITINGTNASLACFVLAGTDMKVQLNNVAGTVLSTTTTPAITADAGGLHVSANGATFGTKFVLFITYLPSTVTTMMTANIGQPITAISASTPTP